MGQFRYREVQDGVGGRLVICLLVVEWVPVTGQVKRHQAVSSSSIDDLIPSLSP